MLHNGTAYLLDHQGRDDNEQIYRNLQLHLNPLDQSPNVKRKAKIGHGAGALRLSCRSCRTAMATKPWPDRIVDGAAGHFIKSGKTAAGAIFNVIATDVAVYCHFFMAATSAVRWWLTARFLSFPWFVVSARTHANGPADAGCTRLHFAAEIFPMNVFSRYLIRHLFLGFAAAAGLLLPLFTTFNLINELDDVSPGGYRWTQAVLVVLMTLPRTLVELSPFIALLGGIVGPGQLSKNSELTAIRSTGFSIFRIALVALVAGILWTVSLGAIDEWVASPLQQQALQIKSTATALGEDDDITGNMLWAGRGNEFVTVKSLNEQGQPVGVEIFHYRDDLSLESYIYARSATIEDDKTWILHGVNHKKMAEWQRNAGNIR